MRDSKGEKEERERERKTQPGRETDWGRERKQQWGTSIRMWGQSTTCWSQGVEHLSCWYSTAELRAFSHVAIQAHGCPKSECYWVRSHSENFLENDASSVSKHTTGKPLRVSVCVCACVCVCVRARVCVMPSLLSPPSASQPSEICQIRVVCVTLRTVQSHVQLASLWTTENKTHNTHTHTHNTTHLRLSVLMLANYVTSHVSSPSHQLYLTPTFIIQFKEI